MRLLVLSPGEPTLANSGLGVAANALNHQLSKLAQLIIVHPKGKSIEQIINKKTTEVVEVETLSFSEENVVQEDIVITIQSNLDPYHYTASFKKSEEASLKELTVKKELVNYTEQVVEKVSALEFDVIYAHDWITFKAAVEIKEKTGKPLAVHIHSLDYDRGGADQQSFIYDIEKSTIEASDMVFAVSQYTSDILQEHYQAPASKIKVVYNAIGDLKLPQEKKTFPEKLVLFVGRLAGQKGPGIFMEIAEQLMKKRNDLRFVMVGGGELMKELVERGANPQSNGKFHFTGPLSYDEVLKLYSIADVYCMPSVSEPFGLSALEAAQAGIPMVISKQSGAAEVLKGALVSDHWDINTFVRHTNKILNNGKLASEIINANKASAAQLTWETAGDSVFETLKSLYDESSGL